MLGPATTLLGSPNYLVCDLRGACAFRPKTSKVRDLPASSLGICGPETAWTAASVIAMFMACDLENAPDRMFMQLSGL